MTHQTLHETLAATAQTTGQTPATLAQRMTDAGHTTTPRAVAAWLAGERTPSRRMFRPLLDALNVVGDARARAHWLYVEKAPAARGGV